MYLLHKAQILEILWKNQSLLTFKKNSGLSMYMGQVLPFLKKSEHLTPNISLSVWSQLSFNIKRVSEN